MNKYQWAAILILVYIATLVSAVFGWGEAIANRKKYDTEVSTSVKIASANLKSLEAQKIECQAQIKRAAALSTVPRINPTKQVTNNDKTTSLICDCPSIRVRDIQNLK
mgnify:CR=1 FL=1